MPKAQMPAELADRDGNRISDSLQVRLEKAAPSARFDVIVTFTRAGSVAAAQARVGRFDVKRQFRLIRGVSASLSASQIRALSRMPGVFRIEENAKVQVAMSAARADFGADLAVSTYGVDGTGVGICVIDTGADGNHEQLDGGKIASWKDFVSNQATPYDDHSHGTHVASIAAGAGTGGSLADDFRGVAPGAPLHIAKALDAAGNGDEDVIIAAIQWCAEKVDVHVISMSLGTITASDGGDAMSQAVNNAVTTKGKVVVVAAGNSGDAPSTVGSPGAAVYATAHRELPCTRPRWAPSPSIRLHPELSGIRTGSSSTTSPAEVRRSPG